MHEGGQAGQGNRRNSRRDVAGPQSEVVGVNHGQLIVQGGDMVDQPQVLEGVHVRHGRRIDAERREREDASSLPLSHGGLDMGSPHQVGLVWRRGALGVRYLDVIIRTADLVLGAVAAKEEESNC